MADTVAYLLEEMVPELEDLERRGVFSRAEIKRIVAARREHEYRLRRRTALKADFLAAIEARPRLASRLGRAFQRGAAARLASRCGAAVLRAGSGGGGFL